MFTVEDCLESLEEFTFATFRSGTSVVEITNSWDRRFISDVSQFTRSGKSLSSAQCDIALKLISRYRFLLEKSGFSSNNLDILLSSPTYRNAPYQSTVMKREVRWAGDDILIFRLKKNPGIVEDIRRACGNNYFVSENYPRFIKRYSVWMVKVNQDNLDLVMGLIKRHNFDFDDNVLKYFVEAVNAKGKKSIVDIEGDEIVVTVKDDSFFNAWINDLIQLENIYV